MFKKRYQKIQEFIDMLNSEKYKDDSELKDVFTNAWNEDQKFWEKAMLTAGAVGIIAGFSIGRIL